MPLGRGVPDPSTSTLLAFRLPRSSGPVRSRCRRGCCHRGGIMGRVEPEDFVAALRAAVFDPTVKGVMSNLAQPPGRRPSESLREASQWFNGLSEADRRFVHYVVRDATHAALFGVLTLLDGVRALDDPPHGALRLTLVAPDGRESLLNPSGGNSMTTSTRWSTPRTNRSSIPSSAVAPRRPNCLPAPPRPGPQQPGSDRDALHMPEQAPLAAPPQQGFGQAVGHGRGHLPGALPAGMASGAR
jgi:hypothetical protein